MSKVSILFEIFEYLKTQKKWWIAPIIILLILLGAILVFGQGSALAPFIYTLF